MFRYTLTDDDGNVTRLACSTRDVLHWERTGKGRSMGNLSRPSAADHYALAFAAMERQGKLPAGMSLGDVEAAFDLDVENDDDLDPTR